MVTRRWQVDCDKIAVLGANVYAGFESALGPLNNMPLLEKKFHIQNFLFWSITGTILTWIGFLIALYAEIKAVLIVSPPLPDTHPPPGCTGLVRVSRRRTSVAAPILDERQRRVDPPAPKRTRRSAGSYPRTASIQPPPTRTDGVATGKVAVCPCAGGVGDGRLSAAVAMRTTAIRS